MFDIGLQELVVIFVIALIVFGPKNLPQLGRSLGRAMREFRRASDEFRATVETNLQIHETDPLPTPAADPVIEPPSPVAAETGAGASSMLDHPYAPAADAAIGAPDAVGEPYVAQRGAKLFHSRDCGWIRRISEPDRVYFKRVAEAREAGFSGCPVCEPWEPA